MQCLLNILMLSVWNVYIKFVIIVLNYLIRYQEKREEENSENSEDKIEYEMMVTLSGLLYLNQVEDNPATSKQNRKFSRRNHFILYKTHYSKANIWTSECNNCKDCIDSSRNNIHRVQTNLENLVNLEKQADFRKIRENLENSRNLRKNAGCSWKTQGIFFAVHL